MIRDRRNKVLRKCGDRELSRVVSNRVVPTRVRESSSARALDESSCHRLSFRHSLEIWYMSSFAMTKSLQRIAEFAKNDGRYRLDAYVFVQQALAFAQLQRAQARRKSQEGDEAPESFATLEPHLTGQELCGAILIYARELYGRLARVVLRHWGVTSTSDFGEIVFQLIDLGEMAKSPEDQREDFDNAFDFRVAFERDYQIEMPEEN